MKRAHPEKRWRLSALTTIALCERAVQDMNAEEARLTKKIAVAYARNLRSHDFGDVRDAMRWAERGRAATEARRYLRLHRSNVGTLLWKLKKESCRTVESGFAARPAIGVGA